MPGSFFDSNVLLYLASDDTAKADRAEELLIGGGAISVQVLNEITNVARRKMRMSWSETRTSLTTVRALVTVHPVTVATHDTGLALAERYALSIYDALIAAAAVGADCDTLWSEDLQNGMLIGDRLRVVDPFGAR
jgi:predicted nucleic acid-binding protein